MKFIFLWIVWYWKSYYLHILEYCLDCYTHNILATATFNLLYLSFVVIGNLLEILNQILHSIHRSKFLISLSILWSNLYLLICFSYLPLYCHFSFYWTWAQELNSQLPGRHFFPKILKPDVILPKTSCIFWIFILISYYYLFLDPVLSDT